jgi:hypothetical protein
MLELAGMLEELARETIVAGVKAYKRRHRVRRGATPRPGPDTPLWNELARQVASQLRRHGDKVTLGRTLGVPRQRIHQYLVDHSASPDAERTLQLLVWLRARRARHPPGAAGNMSRNK